MKIFKTDFVEDFGDDVVKVTQMGNVVEVRKSDFTPTESQIIKLDAERYQIKKTGEIRFFNKSETRADNLEGISKSLKKLRGLINNNFFGCDNEAFITLTYDPKKKVVENPNDTYVDVKKFMMRLRYKYGSVDYINVLEPHASGIWHMHQLIKFNDLKAVEMRKKDLEDIWGLGFVDIQKINNCDNIGAYLSAYLSDVELNEECSSDDDFDVIERVVDGVSKKFLKGARLRFYPVGMNIFRKSKGIVYPDTIEIPYSEIKKIVGSATPHYQQSYVLMNDDNEIVNRHQYQQFNLKR